MSRDRTDRSAGSRPAFVRAVARSTMPGLPRRSIPRGSFGCRAPEGFSRQGLVLCVDEKSRNQALDRTQPGLPMKKGRAGTMTRVRNKR